MKGQFFIVGAIFICALLFFGIAPTIRVTDSPSADMELTAENLAKEYPHALNIGINSSAPLQTLYNFTVFSESNLLDRGIDFNILWIVFRPLDGSTNVTIYNAMDSSKVVGVNVSGTYTDIEAPLNNFNNSVYSVPVYGFNFSVTIDGDETEGFAISNKTSLYSLISLERGTNLVRKELLA